MGKRNQEDRETGDAAIWKLTSKKLDTARDNWRDWIVTGMPSGFMMAAYVLRRDDEGFD